MTAFGTIGVLIAFIAVLIKEAPNLYRDCIKNRPTDEDRKRCEEMIEQMNRETGYK